ncbi:LLM class F420-dependent oxidoreductase [Jatrophihabitans sp. DSM 45814]
MDLSGIGIWSHQLRFGDRSESAEAAAELEELGFSAVWIPDTGGAVFAAVAHLLAATDQMVVATGILNLWMNSPEATAAAYAELSAAHGDRFLLGIGVSHAPLIDRDEPGRYQRPLAAMATFLDGLDQADKPVPASSRVLAALGPKMLEMARLRSRGVHPYLVTPEHTALARQAVGADALVLPEQTVILCSGMEEARSIGDAWLRQYLSLPNYANSLLRLGFSPDDLTSVSDRLFSAVIAWGDEDTIGRRVDEHRAAGADHICVQVLTSEPNDMPRTQWRRLAAALL